MSDVELRVDPLTGLKTIIAASRAERPGGGFTVYVPPPIDEPTDPFLEGHESRTPPEVYAVRPGGGPADSPGWLTRVVPNLYPAVRADAPTPQPHANADLFSALPSSGAHEVIINCPNAVANLVDLRPKQFDLAIDTWRERMRAHGDQQYVHLSLNEGKDAGASLPHSHAQLYALDFVPQIVARERERFSAYAARTMGQNLLGDLIQEEVRQKTRIVAVDDDAVLLAPYASRLPFQLMVAPRRPLPRFSDDGPTGSRMLHNALKRLVRRLGAAPPLNLWIRTAPRGTDEFCWRIDILPRLTYLAGLELGVGINLCVISPELAASELRDV